MFQFSDNTFSRYFSRFSERVLSLHVSTLVGVAILVSVFAVAAAVALGPSHDTLRHGAVLSIVPHEVVDASDEFVADLILTTYQSEVFAVAAQVMYDPESLSIECVRYSRCPGVGINTVFEHVSELSQNEGVISLVVTSDDPLPRGRVRVATLRFSGSDLVSMGNTAVTVDLARSSVVLDDGQGTDILVRSEPGRFRLALGNADEPRKVVLAAAATTLQIRNLTTVPQSRSAIIRWGTFPSDGLSDSALVNLSPPNGQGVTTFSDSTLTLSHSIRVTGLEPNTTYSFQVRSSTSDVPPETAIRSGTFTTTGEDLSLDTNVILKARRDRVCDEWLECTSSVRVASEENSLVSMCFDFGLCDEIDPQSLTCKKFIRPDKNTLNYKLVNGDPSQSTIDQARFVTGYVKAGATWQGFAADGVVPGYYPYSRMDQVGSSLTVPNGDLETRDTFPWEPRLKSNVTFNPYVLAEVEAIPERSDDLNRDLNYMLRVRPAWNFLTSISGTKIRVGKPLRAGVKYYVAMDVRTDDQEINELRVQLGFNGYKRFPDYATDFVPISGGWQRVVAGPLEVRQDDVIDPDTGLPYDGDTFLGVLIDANALKRYLPFYLDNVSIRPVLEAAPGEFVTRSCRGYASDDALACQYLDTDSGRTIQGWEGFCIEPDPRNPARCLQWWPVDVIAGSQASVSSGGTQGGYGSGLDDRVPLYYCLEASGKAPYYDNVIQGACESECGWYKTSDIADYVIDVQQRGIHVYKDEILEVRVNDIDMDKDSGGKYDCSLTNDDPGINPSGDRTIVLNSINKEHWSDQFDTNKDCGGGNDSQYNKYAYLRCGKEGKENNCNVMTARMEFDGNDKLTNIIVRFQDGGPGDGRARIKSVTITYRGGRCDTVVQVVDSFGNNTVRAGLIDSPIYRITDIRYDRGQDVLPFGSIIPPNPDNDPTKWDSDDETPGFQALYAEPPNKTKFPQAPYQARAGSPYGVTQNRTCSTGNIGNACTPATEAADCNIPAFCSGIGFLQKCVGGTRDGLPCDFNNNCPGEIEGQCGVGIYLDQARCVSGRNVGQICGSSNQCGIDVQGNFGMCSGVTPPDDPNMSVASFLEELNNGPRSPVARLSELFIMSYGTWVWNGQYELVCETPGECFYQGRQVGWDNRNTGVAPWIDNATIKSDREVSFTSAQNVYLSEGQGSVVVQFNSYTEPDQEPLVRYTVDWEDGGVSEESQLKMKPRRNRKHLLSHTYFCDDEDQDPKNGFQNINYDPALNGCTFQPTIQIEDNWGWCSGTDGNNFTGNGPCTSIDRFQGKVIVCAGVFNGVSCNPIVP